MHPADANSEMSQCQFSINRNATEYFIYPTLEPDHKRPCAQFINAPLRKKQGHYTEEVGIHCRQQWISTTQHFSVEIQVDLQVDKLYIPSSKY